MASAGGHVCAAVGCKNRRVISKESFFTFPKGIQRARQWAVACGRVDLIENLPDLHRGYRLCGRHFEGKMFLNDLCNRLQPHAVPTIFPSQEGSSSTGSSSVTEEHNLDVTNVPCVMDVGSSDDEMTDVTPQATEGGKMVKKKGQRCCVPGCNSDTINSKVSFHFFPKIEEIKKVWVKRINGLGYTGNYSMWTPTKHHRICGLHFNKTGKKAYEDKYPCYFTNKTYPKHHTSPTSELPSMSGFHNEVAVMTSVKNTKQEHHVRSFIVTNEEDQHIEVKLENPLENAVGMSVSDKFKELYEEHNYALQSMTHLESAGVIKLLQTEIVQLKEQQVDYDQLKMKYQHLKTEYEILKLRVSKS